MTKHDVAELLPFYANGTLSATDRARVDAELASCESCAAELQELQALSASLNARAADAPALPAHLLDATLVRIGPSATLPVSHARSGWWGLPVRYATAAALVLGFGTASFAAYHQLVAQFVRTAGVTVDGGAPQAMSVYRVTPGPAGAPAPAAKPYAGVGGVRSENGTTTKTADAPAAVAKQHRLAKKARIALLVRDVEASLKESQRVVRDAGGEVTSLADDSPRTSDAVHSATLQIEVPADRLDGTLDRLALLGNVQTRAIDAEDVDSTIVDEEARLRNLRREEADLRALMDKGGKVTDILTVQENLSDVRGQIEQLDAQHRNDVHRVATSTIDITLSEDRPNAAPAKPGPSARIDGAWHSGLNALGDTVVAFLTTIVWCAAYAPVPLTLAGLGYGATRLIRRRVSAV